jgi:hypothetical protein
MAFFKRILQEPPPAAPAAGETPGTLPAVERRRAARFPVSPGFPLRAVLNYIGRDDTGAPMSASRHGWQWKGRLLDCSELGARMQLGPGHRAIVGEACDLRLSVQDFEIVVPCEVTHLRANPEGVVFGLRHDLAEAAVARDYRELVEVIALGSTLRMRTRSPQPDESGYFVERYASSRPSALTIWRNPRDGAVSAFEFILKDCMVRVALGQDLEYFSGDADGARRASSARCLEIHRLFQWVVPTCPTRCRTMCAACCGTTPNERRQRFRRKPGPSGLGPCSCSA